MNGWEAPLFAVIGGLIGAALGAFVAWFLRRAPAGRIVGLVAMAGLAVAGALVAKSLAPVGPAMEAAPDDVIEELKQDRILAAIFAREPELEIAFRDELAAIAASDYAPAAAAERGFAFSRETVGAGLLQYLQRGRDEDIVAYYAALTGIITHLAAAHPGFCHIYLFEPERLASYTPQDLSARLTPERHDALQEAGAAVVLRAFEEIPDYDSHTAGLVIAMGAMLVYETLGEERIALVTMGERPRTEEDARAACEAMASVQAMYLASDRPGMVFRHLMVISQGE